MEGQTKVTWDFLETAFRAGTLDQMLALSKSLTDKKYESQAQVFEDLEDAVDELDDFSGVDETLEKLFGLMQELNDQETLEGLNILLSVLGPVVSGIMEAADRDVESLSEMKLKVMDNLPKVGKALIALASIGSRELLSASDKSADQYGKDMGRAINTIAESVNDMHDKNPSVIPDLMAGVSSALDPDQVSKMAETLTNGLLDQRPPMLKWTAATMVKRAKKRLLGN